MPDMVQDVRDFHRFFGVRENLKPGTIGGSELDLALDLIAEEWNELVNAAEDGDLTKTADGIADLIWVVIGLGVRMGIPIDQVWNTVAKANMAKKSKPEHAADCLAATEPLNSTVRVCRCGAIQYSPQGKVMKPHGWVAPDGDINSILLAAML